MAKPFKGEINVDITESVPDWEPYTQPIGPDGTPSVLYIVLYDVGFSAMEPFWGMIESPNINRIAARGLLYTNLHHRPVLTDSVVPDDRPQPHHQRKGDDHRGRVRLPQLQRARPVRVRDDCRSPRRARLEHVHDRQVAPDPRGRNEPGLGEEPVADRPGV